MDFVFAANRIDSNRAVVLGEKVDKIHYSLDSLSNRQPPTHLNDAPSSDTLHCPLPFKDSLRLLEILPGTKHTPIGVRVHLARLGDRPNYEALSYVWGQPDPNNQYHKLILDGDNVSVTPNLFRALERIRLQNHPRFIWVDQLCINQSDEDEKGHQVQLMSRIFKTANRVLVWLGKDDLGISKAAFRLVCEVVNYHLVSPQASFTSFDNTTPVPVPETLPDIDSPRWQSLQSLFDLKWFWRVWIIQEITLSATASMIWGDSEIEWSWVGLTAAIVRINMSNVLEQCFMPGIFNAYFMYRISAAAKTVFKPVSLSFLRLLTMTQQYEAKDPKDRVYGLLGVPSTHSDLDGSPFITPDYSLSTEEVYKAVALRIIEVEGNLSLLSSVQHGPTFCPSQESWVPRWDREVCSMSLLSGDDAHRHKADGGIPMNLRISNDSRCLSVRGLDAGAVTPHGYDGVWQSSDEVLDDALQASEDIALLSLTLTAGKDWYGTLVENEESHLADFAAWVVARLELSMSGISLESSLETPKYGLTVTEDKGKRVFPRVEFSARSLRPQERMLTTNNAHHDFVFPPSRRQVVTCANSGIQGHLDECVDRHVHTLQSDFHTLAKSGDAWRFAEAARSACDGHRIFFTGDGRLGLGPAAMRRGDHLCILFGSTVPFILRPEGQSWRLIGECYVKTLMSGQGIHDIGLENARVFEIC